MQRIRGAFLLLLATILSTTDAFLPSSSSCFSPRQYVECSSFQAWASDVEGNDNSSHANESLPSRRDILQHSSLSLLAAALVINPTAASADDDVIPNGMTPIKTDSGLKYIDLEPGGSAAGYSDATPKYGQICVVSYTAYMKLPAGGKEKQKFDSTSGFVIKHGNGKMIAGFDEGIHGMKRGGLRRIIISPKLGFVVSGLGPLPQYPWQRFKLNSLLDEMVAQRGGNLVYDVRLERFFDDEADQGYYDDLELTPAQREDLESRLLKGRQGSDSAVEAISDDASVDERPKQKPIV
jgi:FKBP-type peptidyl-prolyl cis-trans isomerase